MSEFADNHVTNLGSALLARVLAGEGELTFTRIVMGNGNMPSSQTPSTMTDVVSPKATMSVTKAAVGENQTAVIGGRFDNTEVTEEFEWRELGIYAKVGGDASDVLYSYGYTPAGELIPAGDGPTVVEKLVDLVTYVGDATEVTAIFDPDFIPQVSRIEETAIASIEGQSAVDPTTGKSSEYLDRPGLSKLWADVKAAIDGAGPDLTADEVTITLAGGTVITLKDGGVSTDKLAAGSVSTDKLADGSVTKDKLAAGAIDSTVIVDQSITSAQLADESVTVDKLDLSSVTPAAIGAAAAEHSHDAANITSGTLPLARGGTGVTTLDALRQEVLDFPTNEELLEYLGLS